MSREELVSAYLEGRVSRRTLIRRLVAAGVSTGAAVSYAHLLSPERASAGVASDDHYPLVDLRITSSKLARVRNRGKLAVKLACSEELRGLELRVFLRTAGGGTPIGYRYIQSFLGQAGSRKVAIPIDSSRLAGRRRARLYVQATGVDDERYPALASAGKTLS